MYDTQALIINNLSLSFTNKTCFESFSATVHFGYRIAIIGRNGTGKSSLLKMLVGLTEPMREIFKFQKMH